MRFIGKGRGRFVGATLAMLLAAGIGVAMAAQPQTPAPSNAFSAGRGVTEFGNTHAHLRGHNVSVTYTKGFFCDTSVKSTATSQCEAGEKWNKPPAKDFDPLYITVPLGFTLPMKAMQCPDNSVCVDHFGTIDLRRLEPALKPLYPDLTDAQLTAALRNYRTPGHQHFITTKAHGAREWWDVRIVGVTDKAEYQKITRHGSVKFLKREVKAGRTTGVIPTNAFLFFGVN